ncbi:hypothetical protein PO124_09365 [Bacillus licheniformis]|nr:hypothetical protein [Bacillus licheniformis]
MMSLSKHVLNGCFGVKQTTIKGVEKWERSEIKYLSSERVYRCNNCVLTAQKNWLMSC